MTRTWRYVVLTGLLWVSLPLGVTRADDMGTASLHGTDEYFFVAEEAPDDQSMLEISEIELTAYQDEVVAPPAQDVPLHETTSELAPVTPAEPPAPDAGMVPGPLSTPACDMNACSYGSCQNCCDSGCDGCGPIYIQNGWSDVWQAWGQDWCRCCPSGLYAGAEMTYLVPLDEPTNRVVLSDPIAGISYSGAADPSIGVGIRTWIGLQCDGWGIRARYWNFGNENIDNEPMVPTNLHPAIHEAYELNADVLDIELTQRFHVRCWQLDTSFGARYANLERNATVLGYGQVGNGVDLYGMALGANEIEGTGFTASLGGRRSLGDCCGWRFFWNFRGSVLWSDATSSSFTEATAITNNPAGVSNSRDVAFITVDHSENVWIADATAGLEYDFALCRAPGIFTFRIGLEYQYWNTGDLRSQSESFAFLQGGPPGFAGRADANSFAHDGDLDLIGLVMGVSWAY